MKDRNLYYFNLLSTIAKDLEPTACAKVSACIVYNNRIVSFGTNSKRTDPFVLQYRKHPQAIFIHAETDAIKKARRILSEKQLKHTKMYVCRISVGRSKWALAKPCIGCYRAILEYNIKKVYYTCSPGVYEELQTS